MANLMSQLEVHRCPHCNVDRPHLQGVWQYKTDNYQGGNERWWIAYACNRCGGVILCCSRKQGGFITEQYPGTETLDDEAIPSRALAYLNQAIDSLHSPAGAVMLAASAVDAMLKAKGYKDGSLYERINGAVKNHLITEDVGKWAHEVRLDANDQRHVDEKVPLPDEADAKRVVEFSKSLAEFLFVLPAQVTRGIKEATNKTEAVS